eukprot:3883473-Heterocapsa_arctica.AAC.1
MEGRCHHSATDASWAAERPWRPWLYHGAPHPPGRWGMPPSPLVRQLKQLRMRVKRVAAAS